MLRMNTVNPPGNEMLVARYLDSVLRDAGIETRLLEPTPGRGAVVARIRGNGSKSPVMLLAHMDTVGVVQEQWSVPPFGGEVRDGYVYGRGAIDDKGMLAVHLQTMLLLQRTLDDGADVLARDVVFVASADEETGGEWGLAWLLHHHRDLLDAEFVLNEGGRIRVVGGRPLYVALQTAEKVPHNVTITAQGPGGHAAIPLAGNAILRLARALASIGAHAEPLQLTETTRAFFSHLSSVWPDAEAGAAMADVASGDAMREQRGAAIIAQTPVLDALLRNGISATLVTGGTRSNVIPTEAVATLNVRTLPGQTIDDVVARLEHAIDDSLVTLAITDRGGDVPASSLDSALVAALGASARALDPALTVVPYLSTGATDSARLRALGMQVVGVLPFPMNQDDEERMHGNDERLALSALEFGTRMVFGAIREVAR